MKRKILSLAVFTFLIITSYSQSFVSTIIRGERGISKQFAAVGDNQKISFNSSQLKALLDLDQNSDLVLWRTEQDKLGFIHYRYYQTYRGVPVENSMYIVHTKYGVLKSLGGSIVTDFDPLIDQRTSQKVSQDQAIEIAVKYVGAKVYAWQDAGMEKEIKDQTKNAKASYAPNASLVWFSPANDVSSRELRLCYKVDVYAREPLSRAYYFVDALNGQVLGKKDEIFYSDATGTAATAYSGSQIIHSDLNGSSYRLRDYTKGNGIITLHGESGSSGTDYTSSSPNWSLSGTNQAALDAHYGVSQTYAFYKTVFNRNSYDNAGTALYSYVNIPNTTDNAYWDGSAMNYGKRSTGAAGGVTGIDVTGHELTHGVTQSESNLNYSKEPGAMNESMSDIFGKSVQFWSKPSDVNWKLSNDMNWIIRDMSNPNAEGQPDTYKGTYWATSSADNYGVHTNSGVGNFMFYLLVTGGSGTNDKGSSYSVTGIGLTEADAILYRTNTVYLVPTSQYADWRTACINAATDLYGSTSNEVVQVENAWYAVGIGTAGGGGGSCNIPTGLASSSITSSSATVSWSAATGAISYNLQYKVSTSSTWITVSGITGTSYGLTNLSASTTYNFQVQSVCSGGSTSAYSAVSSFTTLQSGGIVYCTTKGNTTYEYINKVVLGSISNTSGNNSGYGDYTALSTNLTAGGSASITVTPGFTGSSYSEYWRVFIDYNHNGTLNDAGEMITVGNGSGSVTKSFTVPSTALNGATRMRIVMHYSSARTNPCGTFSDGEAEDYTVNITGGTFSGFAVSNASANTLNSIIVSPNPVKVSTANVAIQVNKAAPVIIRITDLSGRVLVSKNISNVIAGKNNVSLNNLNLLPGTYMIIAEQNSSVVARNQFIVAK
jgi:bacillolysin